MSKTSQYETLTLDSQFHTLATSFSLNSTLPSCAISTSSESVASSATNKSVISFHSSSRRHRRGKSRIVSKQDFYNRSNQSEVQSELMKSDEENKNIEDLSSQDGIGEVDSASVEVSPHLFQIL